MRAENYISFFTVCGFFVGLAFVVIKIDEPFEMVAYLFLTTFFFYLFIHVIIMNFVETAVTGERRFKKEQYEEINEYLISELGNREKRMEAIVKIKQRDLTLKKSGKKKNEHPKAKAA